MPHASDMSLHQCCLMRVLHMGAEYRQGSFVFREKIRSLEMQYESMRRTRGDGNCFFRSFMFAFMEKLVQDNDLTERNRCAWPLLLHQLDVLRLVVMQGELVPQYPGRHMASIGGV